MTDLMFEAPGRKNLSEIAVTADLVKAQLKDPATLLGLLVSAPARRAIAAEQAAQ